MLAEAERIAPKRFPGCWSSHEWLRAYWRAWWKARGSGNPARLARHREEQRRWIAKPANHRKALRWTRRWRRQNAARNRALSRRSWWRRRSLCFVCGQPGLRGRRGAGALRRVTLEISSRCEEVWMCRTCRGLPPLGPQRLGGKWARRRWSKG